MLTPHHSFSSRIFLTDSKDAMSAPATERERKSVGEIRDFWWFLRAGQMKQQDKTKGRPDRKRPPGFGHQGGAHA